jgi:hypothetical protein
MIAGPLCAADLEDEIFVEVFGVGEKATEAYERVLRCTPKAFDAGSQRRASTMRRTGN